MCEAQMEMPKYKCHKEVWALKIKEVQTPEDSGGERILVPENERYAPFSVGWDYVKKHQPEAGGYYVVYEDGYKSFSPARPFEDGYILIGG